MSWRGCDRGQGRPGRRPETFKSVCPAAITPQGLWNRSRGRDLQLRRVLSTWSEQIGDELSIAAWGGVWQEDAAGHTQPPLPPPADISDRSCLAGCSVRPTAVPTAALCHPAVSRPLRNYSALRLTWQSSLFSAAGLKYLL